MWDDEEKGCGQYIVVLLIALAIIFAVTCFEGWLVMLLWNAVVPMIWAEAPRLSFWLAVGVLLLCNLLFKVVRGGGKKS